MIYRQHILSKKYRQLYQRILNAVRDGRFFRYTIARQHALLTRLQRYARRLSIPLGTIFLLNGLPSLGLAQLNPTRQGTEFRVNAFTAGGQENPAIAMSALGRTVIAYESELLDGNGDGIFLQLYDGTELPLTGEILVNTFTTGNQEAPAVAMDADGDFVVVWQSEAQDGSSLGIFGQRFDANGTKIGTEFSVNAYTTGNQQHPAIAMDADGDFVVVWDSEEQDGSVNGVYGQRFNTGGVKQGGEFLVNTNTFLGQQNPDVAMDAYGDFVVVWDVAFLTLQTDIYGQRFNAGGVKQGGEFLVNTYTTTSQNNPALAMDANGDFTVVWESANQPGESVRGIYGQRFAANAVPLGSEFPVNTYTTGSQLAPDIAMDADGDFTVVWQSVGQDGQAEGIYGQRYYPDGQPYYGEFLINTFTTDAQMGAAVATDADGDFTVAWSSQGQEGPTQGNGVYAQGYFLGTGEEFIINTYTTGQQSSAAIAMDADGNFVVAWVSGDPQNPGNSQDGSGYGIFAQRYSANGEKQGAEFQVNSFTLDNQLAPAIAMDTDGDFIIVWTSRGQDGSNNGIYGQRFSPNGMKQGGEFRINTYTLGFQNNPAVAMDTRGNFVVSWESDLQDGSNYGVYGQRYANNGNKIGGEFRVNTHTEDRQGYPKVAMDANGNFVVSWSSNNQDGSANGIYGQRFAANVTPQGNEFQINTFTTNSQGGSVVAMDADGDFVVAWVSENQEGEGLSVDGIYAQRYSAAGNPQGGEFLVNTFTTGSQVNPSIAMDKKGDFVVTWCGSIAGLGVFAQRFTANGDKIGGEFRVNSGVMQSFYLNDVAMDADGDFAVVWETTGPGSDGSGSGILGQRYQGKNLIPCALDPLDLTGSETGTINYRTQADITSTQTIENGSNVRYQSGTAIQLLPGFHAQPGATFSAEIVNCGNVAPFTETAPPVNQFRTAETIPITTQLAISLAPNPTRGQLALKLESQVEETAILQIINLNGIVLHRQTLKLFTGINQQQLDVNRLARGTYILQIQTGTTRKQVKFVKL